MKKSTLVLAVAMTLGMTATAFAANPFSDVPKSSWAYAAVEKLAAEGVIDGMGNGKFEGNRNMTRYEMAQIVAKAMAKGVQRPELQKLAQEFSQELNTLGVRVNKLEQKVQISGEFRLRYRGMNEAKENLSNKTDDFSLRTRLHLNGTINKNWSAYMMLENTQNMMSNSSATVPAGEGSVYLRRAVATGKYDNFQVRLGRVPYTDKDGMLFNPAELDGMVMDYKFGTVKATALYGRFAPFKFVDGDNTRVDSLGFALDWDANKQLNFNAAFYNHKVKGIYTGNKKGSDQSANVWDLMATYKVQDWKFSAMYIGANKEIVETSAKNGYAFRVAYGMFSPAKKGSYMVQANYFKIPTAAHYGSPYQMEDLDSSKVGAKGWSLVADYAIEKNIRLHASYIDAKGTDSVGAKTKAYTAYATFYF